MSGIAFYSPTNRAAGTDLAVNMGPTGLLDLSSEEFDIHGARISRYNTCWAWWLGHHWTHRRAQGDPQLTLNYVRALGEYKINFTFGKGVRFGCPEQNLAVIPPLLDTVWTQHNERDRLLREIAQYGTVTGDVFVKVAFEFPFEDGIGRYHEGAIRILPINPGNCFPTFHPHDRTRMLQMKMKYRFWAPDATGTMKVHTYVEQTTDSEILEFIDDRLIDQRMNPLAKIPFVHIPNIMIAGTPWGESDIWQLIPINREYNEKMTEFSDIINYYSAPITVLTGAKANDLVRGHGKVYAIPDHQAKMYNLETQNDYAGMLNYMKLLKASMHELSGVPETALGQAQPISNTSGVALQIQFQPLMNVNSQKQSTYGLGIVQINELVILTAAVFRPEMLQWSPTLVAKPEYDHMLQLDPRDPLTYVTTVDWPEPLPVDNLITLNEEMMKMQLGLQSKKGALSKLGEQNPGDKIAEIAEEQKEDAVRDGALRLIQAGVDAVIMQQTGMVPQGGGTVGPPSTSGAPSGDGATGPAAQPIPLNIDEQLANDLLTQAYGTKTPQRFTPLPANA